MKILKTLITSTAIIVGTTQNSEARPVPIIVGAAIAYGGGLLLDGLFGGGGGADAEDPSWLDALDFPGASVAEAPIIDDPQGDDPGDPETPDDHRRAIEALQSKLRAYLNEHPTTRPPQPQVVDEPTYERWSPLM